MTLTFTFVNPNPPKSVEQLLRRILLEKLLAQIQSDSSPSLD